MQTKSFNKKVLSKLVASSLLFASASWASAMEIQGFFSAGGGVTFDTPKLPRNENMIADQNGRNHNLNTVSEYHKTVSPELRSLSSRFNAHTKNKVGMQFYKRLSDDMSFTTQLLATGEDSDFDFNAKWGFLSWEVQPNFTLRAGRLVIPLFMLSEYLEVGYAYPWVTPPMEMYSGVPLDSWSGIDFSWTGYRGDWDYRVTAAFGTLDEVIWVGGISDDFKVRNGASFNVDVGNDYLRMRLGASRVDMASSLGLDTVDAVVGGIGTLYAGWAVNKFDSTGDGTIDNVDYDNWKKWLGSITSATAEGAAGVTSGVTWTDVIGKFGVSENLGFLQAATGVGLAGVISNGTYGELTNMGGLIGKAAAAYDMTGSEDLAQLQTLGEALASADSTLRDSIKVNVLPSSAGYDLAVFNQIAVAADETGSDQAVAAAFAGYTNTFADLPALIAGLNSMNSYSDTGSDGTITTKAELSSAMAAAAEAADPANQAAYTNAYVSNATINSENIANAIFGTLGALGATENSGRFNAVAQLLALSGEDVAGNYGLLQQAIKSVVNETYLMELRQHLYKTFNHNWRSGSFLSAGYTYDYDNWYSIGEYGYRRVPGYLGDTEGWYVTLGRRFGSIMPHITYAGVSMKDKHVRQPSAGIQAGNSDATNDWRVMLNNVQDDSAAISDVTYENMMYGLDALEKFWFDNQAYTQNSVTVGVRYDWKPGISLKAEVQHVRPKLGQRGFMEPWDLSKKMTANSIALSVDAVF